MGEDGGRDTPARGGASPLPSGPCPTPMRKARVRQEVKVVIIIKSLQTSDPPLLCAAVWLRATMQACFVVLFFSGGVARPLGSNHEHPDPCVFFRQME